MVPAGNKPQRLSSVNHKTIQFKVGQKVQTLGPPYSRKNSKFSKVLQKLFLSAKILPPVQISAKLNHIWGSKGPAWILMLYAKC